MVLSFLALMDARCCRLEHSSCYPQLSWRSAVGMWGKVVSRSECLSIWKETGLMAVGVFLFAVLHGPQEKLPPGPHTGRWLKRFNN